MAEQTGQGIKKETVYQGPPMDAPAASQSSQPVPMRVKETVYEGPSSETVFNEKTFIARKPDTTVSRAAMTKSSRRSAIRFFLVSVLAGLEFMSYRGESQAVSINSLMICIIFFLLGFFAYRLSRGAFLAAILIYGASTILMVLTALTSELGILFVLKPLIARCILIYNLQQKYCQLTDLYELESM